MDDSRDENDVKRRIRTPVTELQVNFSTWPSGQNIYRIHSICYTAIQFNPGTRGNARFSPVYDSRKQRVPTLYGGINTGVAVMETLFHDLPEHTDGVAYDMGNLRGMAHSVIAPKVDLNLVDLNPKTMKKMGVNRAQLLDSTADQYIYTQEYATAIHAAHPAAHGLKWSSRQHGDSALMLFGDRVHPDQLAVISESEVIIDSNRVLDAIDEEADQLGVVLLDADEEPDISGPIQ
ncbi:RES domain-containing protein [Serratia proteamaculans]|uniref:RES family NAD+ phosphorylase n=1 Tax=Serratia proteamaculans TaxID=28151 RepID=UPI00107617BB|nr:RES family NAD+ phosphorylase [Serratia proteamaculans]TFZ49835.1 RES domain-containing protein [Serratia proteamaculans]